MPEYSDEKLFFKKLTSYLSNYGFYKLEEEHSNLFSVITYRAEAGIYLKVDVEYLDQLIIMNIGNRYCYKGNTDQCYIKENYEKVLNMLNIEYSTDCMKINRHKSWKSFESNFFDFLNNTFPIVTNSINDELLTLIDESGLQLSSDFIKSK